MVKAPESGPQDLRKGSDLGPHAPGQNSDFQKSELEFQLWLGKTGRNSHTAQQYTAI